QRSHALTNYRKNKEYMMTMKWMFSVLLLVLLTGCSSTPPDLDAPCTQFGRYCPKYPINEVLVQVVK
ncbi:MAG: hypothetical protein PSV35_08460, partial [bacterium]|nr:hypothetical protein [bacterium]